MIHRVCLRVGEHVQGRIQGEGAGGAHPPPTCGFLIQLVLCKKKRTMWFIGVEVDKRRVHPLLKKILDPPLMFATQVFFKQTMISPIVLPGNPGVLAIYADNPLEILCINIKLQNLRWWENDLPQSISKSAEKTEKEKLPKRNGASHLIFLPHFLVFPCKR